MTVPLQVTFSLAFATACIVIAVVSFTPTYVTGVDGVQETVDSLRASIDKNLETALINYIAEPQDVNDVLAMELMMSLQGITPEQQFAYKHWCVNMLKAKSNSLYIAFGTEDGNRQPNATTGEHAGVFLGCESVKAGGKETYYYHVRNATYWTDIASFRLDYNTYEEVEQTNLNPYDARLRGWYLQLKNGQGWTGTYMFSDGSKFAVTAGKPWFSASGELLGVATTDFAVASASADTQVTRTFSTMLAGLEYGKTGAAMALDGRDGSVLGISWGESMVTNATGELKPKTVTELELPMFRSVVKSLGGTKEAVLAHPVGQFEYGGRWVSVQDISDDYGFLMRVVVAIPEDDFMSAINKQRVVIVSVVVALIVVVVACGVAFSTAIAGVVQELAENMEQCATMNLETVKESKPSNISEIRSMQSSFHQMHSNLVEYRNYLPQSVLLAGSDAEDAGTDLTERSRRRSSFSDEPSVSGSHTSTTGMRRDIAKAVGVALRTSGLSKRIVSVAVLNVRGFTVGIGNGVSKEQLCANHDKYLTAVLEVARMAKGVVDGFQGDLVWATWNAASNCGTHATSCLTALWQLTTECFSGGDIVVMAAAGTGPALCGNMGCNRMKKFTIVGNVVPMVGLLSKLNRMLDCRVLVEQRMRYEACVAFYFRMRDAIEHQKAQQGLLEVHETHEQKTAASNDEWMYQLDQAARSDPFTGYNAAFRALTNGQRAEALTQLREWKESPVGNNRPASETVGAPFVEELEELIDRHDRYARTELPSSIW